MSRVPALPFGLHRDGTYRTPHEVDRGLDCGCHCPECGRRLIARQGEEVTYHFAHESENAGESARWRMR